jgi:hypothetical protein
MVSGQRGLVIMLVIGCLLLAIISLLFQRTFPHLFVREKIVIHSVEEEAIPQVKETVHTPKIEEDTEFLSGGDFAMEDQSSMRVRCDKDQRYMSQAARDLSWLDTWQTKTHRRSEFAKSMMALILPPTPQSGELPEEEPIEVKDAYDEEMLVVPVNMTTGICDHNLAMGVFLWSPSRSRSKCSVEKDDILGGSTSVQLSDRYMQRKSHTACNIDHTPSPITAPSSASMSALSSAKSSLSVACGVLNQSGYSKSSGRNDMAYEMKEKLGRYMKAPSYPTSPSSSSSSASALSPPPPSTASCYTSRQVSDSQWENQKSRYPLRYIRDKEVNPDESFKNFHSPRLYRDNTNVSSISPPTTREIGSPAKKALRDILEGVAKRHDTHHFHSPYE